MRDKVKLIPQRTLHSAKSLGATMRAILSLLLCFALVQAHAEEQVNAEKDAVIAMALEAFWGRARDSKGAVIQPSSEVDRRTVPIPTNIAYIAIDAGAISGLGQWCGLDWESHYSSITAAARQRGMSDKQVAFISVLHGLMQGKMLASLNSHCSESDRRKVSEQLAASKSLGLGAPNKSLERTRGT